MARKKKKKPLPTDEHQPSQLRIALEHARPYLPLAALVLGLLALWLLWGAWSQFRDDNRRTELQQGRDQAVQDAELLIRSDLSRLSKRMAATEFQAALKAGDLGAASAALGGDWPGGVEVAQVLPTNLQDAYAGLPKAGFGRIAVTEAALAEDAPVASAIREDGKPHIALAVPAKVGAQVVGVAFVRLPLSRVSQGLENATLADDSYLALRQGNATLAERGDTALAGFAERRAVPIPGTDLRVAAAVPSAAGSPFGLGSLAALVAAVITGLLAYVCFRLPQRLPKLQVEDDGSAPTLSQVVRDTAPEDAEPKVAVSDTPKAPPVQIDKGIFRAYDIRGVVGQTLDAGVAEAIGQAIGSLMADQGLDDIVIGRDGRLSGPDLVAGLVQGLRRAGRNVIDIGMVPTPVVYFGAYHLRTGCCISVTGSHNPPDYNGFKIVVGGETLYGDAITDLHKRISEGRLHAAAAPGTLNERDISDDYVERISSDVQTSIRLKVVVDAGNGVAGEIGPRVLEAIGAEVVPLFCEIDGTFPNHHPDPSEPHNLEDLIESVKRMDADLGIAFDGDGDRLGVVTRDGDNIFPDRLLMLFAGDVLERNPGAVILFDVKCSGRLPDHILRHGGSPLMCKTGHSLVKAKMRETGAELAGEMSGHFFFGERWYGFDDGIYAAARLLEILSADPRPPAEVLAALPNSVSTPEIKVDAPGGDPHAFVERFIAQAKFEDGRASTIDGLRIDWRDGWGLVRASNTTPVLVLRFDADNEEALERIKQAFKGQLLAADGELELPF